MGHDLLVGNGAVAHGLKEMADNVRAGGVEDLGTLVDAGEFEDIFDNLVLLVILVFVKGWEPSIAILGTLQPRISPLDFFAVEMLFSRPFEP